MSSMKSELKVDFSLSQAIGEARATPYLKLSSMNYHAPSGLLQERIPGRALPHQYEVERLLERCQILQLTGRGSEISSTGRFSFIQLYLTKTWSWRTTLLLDAHMGVLLVCAFMFDTPQSFSQEPKNHFYVLSYIEGIRACLG